MMDVDTEVGQERTNVNQCGLNINKKDGEEDLGTKSRTRVIV